MSDEKRGRLRRYRPVGTPSEEGTQRMEEILESFHAECVEITKDAGWVTMADYNALRAENETLRKALEGIASNTQPREAFINQSDWWKGAQDAFNADAAAARKALILSRP